MSDILGALGFLCIVAAVFGLAGAWWALLTLGAVLVLCAYAAHTAATAAATAATTAPATAGGVS